MAFPMAESAFPMVDREGRRIDDVGREREKRADQSGSRLADGHRLPVARGIPYGKSRGYPI